LDDRDDIPAALDEGRRVGEEWLGGEVEKYERGGRLTLDVAIFDGAVGEFGG
jgi:hypothetical protein